MLLGILAGVAVLVVLAAVAYLPELTEGMHDDTDRT